MTCLCTLPAPPAALRFIIMALYIRLIRDNEDVLASENDSAAGKLKGEHKAIAEALVKQRRGGLSVQRDP